MHAWIRSVPTDIIPLAMHSVIVTCVLILGGVSLCMASTYPDPDILSLTSGISRFSHEFYKEFYSKSRFFYSPLSTHIALSAVYLGARGTTADQMRSALQLSSVFQSHEAYKRLLQNLVAVKEVEVFSYISANLPLDNDITRKYVDDVNNFYKIPDTANKISRINQISSTTVYLPPMTLRHNLYFSGNWKSPFNPGNTYSSDFKKQDEILKDVEFMNQVGMFGVKLSAFENIDVMRLPFENERFAFYIVLPRTLEDFPSLEKLITDENFDDSVFFNDFTLMNVNITIPKFKITDYGGLKRVLEALGMTIVFSPESNFTGIANETEPIMSVTQLSTLDVSEMGANTDETRAVIKVPTLLPGDPVSILADRPFIFYLRDDESKLIMLQGKQDYPKNIIKWVS